MRKLDHAVLNKAREETACCGGECCSTAAGRHSGAPVQVHASEPVSGIAHGTSRGDGASVTQTVQAHYAAIAERSQLADSFSTIGPSCYNSGGLYSVDELSSVTPQAAAASAGCGNPVALADILPGEHVLDLGSGGGIDCFLAAQAVGPKGRVTGVDMTPAMVALARKNAASLNVHNVTFKLARIEAIPEPDASVDMVMSNCVINLSEQKDLVFAEVFRVLKPGGRMVVSDIVAERDLPAEVRSDPASWAGCVAGADLKRVYLDRIANAGFECVEVLDDAPSSCGEEDSRAALRSITVLAYKPTFGQASV